MPGSPIPPALTEFVRLFNTGAFWESHEALESEWHRTRSEFYHGLILLASAFVHWERQNAHGILAQLGKAEPLLGRFPPRYLGVDLVQALHLAAELRAMAAHPGIQTGGAVRLDLDPGLVQGDEPELHFKPT